MIHNRRLDIEALHTALRRSLRHGARAARLVRYTSELVELLAPAEQQSEDSIYDRAIHTEEILRNAIARIGGDYGEAAEILFGLKAGTVGLTLQARREMAGHLWGIDGDTFRRPRWEGILVWEVAVEVSRLDS